MTINYTIICTCGTKMTTNHGVSINGLEVVAKGFGSNDNPQKYKGANENWRCPECAKEVEVYTGFLKDDMDD